MPQGSPYAYQLPKALCANSTAPILSRSQDLVSSAPVVQPLVVLLASVFWLIFSRLLLPMAERLEQVRSASTKPVSLRGRNIQEQQAATVLVCDHLRRNKSESWRLAVPNPGSGQRAGSLYSMPLNAVYSAASATLLSFTLRQLERNSVCRANRAWRSSPRCAMW